MEAAAGKVAADQRYVPIIDAEKTLNFQAYALLAEARKQWKL